ncbi:hypothetical protein [Gilvibacter sp.]|uniref:hypothetical protein n=1 Tax=Gilvibacter sp. TaxID=2729997 RepID=UPI0025B8873C|nr:hypothetical protein [Gilvibacter sp.]NQX78530.1 hypothetical protein [Gilvibacter sp.]
MTETKKPTALFWVIAVVAIMWNIIGVLQYLGYAFMTDQELNMYTTAEQELITGTPAWATAAFAIAVWFGILGSIALLLKRKFAYPLFLLSLLGIIGQSIHTFFLSDYLDVMGTEGLILPVLVIVLGVVFFLYAKKATAEGILK